VEIKRQYAASEGMFLTGQWKTMDVMIEVIAIRVKLGEKMTDASCANQFCGVASENDACRRPAQPPNLGTVRRVRFSRLLPERRFLRFVALSAG
jgi:hypothetical protein